MRVVALAECGQRSPSDGFLGRDVQLAEQAQRLTEPRPRASVASPGTVQLAQAAQRPGPDVGKAAVHPRFQQRARLRVVAEVHQCGAEADLGGRADEAVTRRPQHRQGLLEHADRVVVAALLDEYGAEPAKQPRLAEGAAEAALQSQGLLEAAPGRSDPAVVVVEQSQAVQHADAGPQTAVPALGEDGKGVLGLPAALLKGPTVASV